ncbi:MAG: hypothetical protein KAJ76_09305 [Candidatus Heimdallarchaeota archaeon]|nr:hypothetical protein [Candidatus Heimdallarchaeota archaeon]
MSESTLYKNCPICNTNLVIMDGIYTITCNGCETKLAYDLENKELVNLGKHVKFSKGKISQATPRKTREYGKKRTYFLYFLFGVWTLGIGFIVYMFRNIRDLENHQSEYKIEMGAEPILSDGELFPNFNSMVRDRFFYSPWYAGIFGLVTIVFDILSAATAKYSMLYFHLKNQSKDTAPTKSPHSGVYLTGLILFLLSLPTAIPLLILNITYGFETFFFQSIFLWVSVVMFGAGFIIIVICGALWQKAFNDHLDAMKKIDPN